MDRWHVGATRVLDGVEPEDWWVLDGLLTREPVAGARELPGSWFTLGLVDAHAHLTFEARDRLGLRRGSQELIGAHLDLQRRAGVLAVRDAGALPGVGLDREPASGGRVIACGPFLVPPDFFRAHLVDPVAPEAAVAAARARIRSGGDWVKLIVDAPGPDGNPLSPVLGYPIELLAEIVAAVHEERGRVAAHVMGQLVGQLVSIGVDSIEHGNWAEPADVRAMAAAGTAWTPTLTTVTGHLEPIAAHVPPAQALLERQRTTLPLAAELGVTLLAGTDEEPHGSVAAEVAALIRYGAPAAAAVAAACDGARRYFGLPEIDEGAIAEIVTFDADPVADPGVLARPAAVLSGGHRIV